MKKKQLRAGYTTGACAAAAAKAAVLELLSYESGVKKTAKIKSVEIPFPDRSRVRFKIHCSELTTHDSNIIATASVIKDAGDDPDVTNGAEIVAEAKIGHELRVMSNGHKLEHAAKNSSLITRYPSLIIKGGEGVGTVTKPGLSVPVGGAAINPVPRTMIEEAVGEAVNQGSGVRDQAMQLEVTISVPQGEELAKKTLNYRLGIVGGISILGTTGIVKPVSSEAWTATIVSSMDVAKAMRMKEIVLSAGRSSEKAHMKAYNFPEESYVLMGDYLEYSLLEARKHEFKKIHLCAQWAKMLKIAMATPQTHVRFGAINTNKAVEFLNSLGITIPRKEEYNTAREMLDCINDQCSEGANSLREVCVAAKKYAEKIVKGAPVVTHLVSYKKEVLASSE